MDSNISITKQFVDDWYNVFGPNNRFVIWGCSDFAEQLIRNLKDCVCFLYIVDIDSNKNGSLYNGIKVFLPDKLLGDRNVKIIISNTYMGTRVKIADQLKSMGFVENVDFTYIELMLSIYDWKINNRITSQYVEVSVTTFCTLKCKNCTAYMPYIEKPCHLPFEELIIGADLYFKSIDYVGRFRILGGEPLVYPDLTKYIEYIGENYRDRIGELCIVTNGTIIPDSQLLSLAEKYHLTFFVSNYKKSGSHIATEDKYEKILRLLENHNIKYYFSDNQKWLHLGSPKELSKNEGYSSLADKFSDCRHYCRSIVEDKLFICATWAFAYLGSIYRDPIDQLIGKGIIDLREFGIVSKEERFYKWFEYDVLMNIPNGFIDFCKYCNGFGSKNTHFVPVGEQV